MDVNVFVKGHFSRLEDNFCQFTSNSEVPNGQFVFQNIMKVDHISIFTYCFLQHCLHIFSIMAWIYLEIQIKLSANACFLVVKDLDSNKWL